MKKLFYIGTLIILLFIMGCSKDESSPNDRMKQYVELWMKSDFTEMYDLLTEEARESFPTDEYVDRYEKVFKDLEINKLEITFTELNDEQEKQAFDQGSATYSLQVKMESIAGPIEFERDMTLQKEKDRASEDDEEKEEWYVEWDPGFIFPDLAKEGKIKIETTAAKRGEILDRNQMPLAINDIAYEIGVVPNLFENKETEIEQIAKLLNITEDSINTSLNASWVEDDHFVPLKVIPKTAEEQLANLLAIPAVTSVETTGRIYPAGEAAAHLTGYIGKVTSEEIEKYPERLYKESDIIGKRGLEQLYEEQLRGTDGVTIIIEIQDADQKEENVLAERPVKHGEHIQVTIDVNLQEKIFNSYGDKSGTAAAIQPKTGEVLALISSPSFDPNELAYGISQAKWDALMEDKKQPFINRFTATYAPGSVLKPITAAIGLANGTIKPEDGVTIEGLTWGKDSWGDYKVKRVSTGANPVDLHSALIRSDNIYFAMKAVEMGGDKYLDGLKQFGLGEELPLTYPFSVSQISNDGKLNDEVLLANTSYGQGEIELSSLHMALTYTVFLNEGNMIKPSFLVDDPKSEIWIENVMDKEDAELMKSYLRDVVTKGTAKVANNDKVAIAGKTGTAELKLSHDTNGNENGWFVAYPSDSEDILIAMMMESVQDVGSSSFVAGKVAEILTEIK
ncbi:penicillin-binding transpeptidase domain-containing protein [Pseudogracilibacillus sp. SE30717A]|uniref:penicillin-binding transpeptidase domain-containing protein n=1 Tax=Pseudogracilibacillus sp. SE30717A TaxID=3098293 RepID=UPI00300DDD3F